MSTAPPISAVLFDLDGTLVDSLLDIHEALLGALAAHGRPGLSVDATRRLIGRGSHQLVAGAVGPGGPIELVRDTFLARYERGLCVHSRLYPELLAVLEALGATGLPMAVATNKPSRLAKALCTELAIAPFFGAIVGGDDAPRKPAPDLLRLAGARLGLSESAFERAVYVGDMDVDQEAARAAGCRFVGAGWGFGADRLVGGERISTPAGLLSWLDAARESQ